jgi:peptidyl-Lys metalloendopeptidase
MQQYWIIIYIAATIMAINGQAQDLRVSVTSVQSRFAAVQNVNVILKYTNVGGDTMSIYKWNVPEKGLFDPLFEVTRDGETVEYVGPMIKRRAPTADDVISVTPGMTVSAAIQLSTVYNMTQSGNYVIQYKMKADQVLFTTDSVLKPQSRSFNGGQEPVLQSAPIVVFAVGRRNLLIEEGVQAGAQIRTLTPTYFSCSSSQSSSIRSAITAAQTYTNNAIQHLSSATAITTRYTTWYGKYSSQNWLQLKSNLAKVDNVLNNMAMSFDCTCPDADSDSTFAYVYPTQPYRIYLCGSFWRAATTGTDSKGGTLVHEIAHFKIVVGTGDHGYGQSNAKNLALTDPAMALLNSDNLEYFVENTPTLY